MAWLLRRLHRSRPAGWFYRRLPFLRVTVDRLHQISVGSSALMTSWPCWQVHRLCRYFRYGFKPLAGSQVAATVFSEDLDTIETSPGRIEFYVSLKNIVGASAAVLDGGWDRNIQRLDSLPAYVEILENAKMGKTNASALGDADEAVTVAIGRHGRLLLESGLRRLSLARATSQASIPVLVRHRHYRWARLRREVRDYSLEQAKGAYQPLTHPDLQGIMTHRKEDRWEMIRENLPLTGGTALDIGANWGYFCHRLEEMGFTCTAVERNYRWLDYLKRFRDIEGRKFSVFSGSVFDLSQKRFDIVLALSVFHHFLRSRKLYEQMTRFLGQLEIKYMFFEPHETGHGFAGAHVDYTEDEFVSYILDNSCLGEARLLGRGERGRNLYLLGR
ncbi:class I SAM-dependent methyltransferase [Chloroflexota bacterium]